jgi:hypothetical protein
MNFIILFMSKNNYDLLDHWIEVCKDFNKPNIINLDLGSNVDQVKYGKRLCEENNIDFLTAEKTQFQDNIRQVFNKEKLEYILYMHQDCFPIELDTFEKINNSIIKNDLSKYGSIGFNIFHDVEINDLNLNNLKLMTTARTILQKGNGYYMRKPKGSRVDYNKFNSDQAFEVENVMWTSLLLSKKSFLKNIEVDLNFNFFFAADDMAFQFLQNNVKNICIPYIHFKHDQSIKTKYNLPKDSPLGDKDEVEKRYGRIDHKTKWKKKWGFQWNIKKEFKIFNYRIIKYFLSRLFPKFYSGLNTISRTEFLNTKKTSKLMQKIFLHDPINGPVSYINLNK